jgi:hypothetical protein
MWIRTPFSFSKANATYTVDLNPSDIEGTIAADAIKHNIVFNVGDSTSGTIAILAKPYGATATRTVKESDGTTAVSLDLTGTNRDVLIEDWSIDTFAFTLASVNGTGLMTGYVNSWIVTN